MPGPTVSVAICIHNGRRYIDETLASVFAQTFQDFEIVIVDDGSTDGTADCIARRFPDPRIRIIRQPHQTLRVARPAALASASGEFVAFLDHDDLWVPTKLDRQVCAAREEPDVALVFSDCFIVDDQGRPTGRLSDQFAFGEIDLTHPHAYLQLLRRGCFVAYPTAFVRASAAREVGGFDRRYQYVSDYDLWLKLARRFQVRCIPEPLASYRVHATQFTQRHADITLKEHTALLRPFLARPSYPAEVRTAILHTLFGQHRVAFRHLVHQRRFLAAAVALCTSVRYPIPLRDYCLAPLLRSRGGRPLKAVLRRVFRQRPSEGVRLSICNGPASDVAREDAPDTSARSVGAAGEIWFDGTSFGREQTGYFNLASELIRGLMSLEPVAAVHVQTDQAGRRALLARLGPEGGRLRFHPAGWRSLHWRQVHELLFAWQAQLLMSLALVIALCAATAGGDPRLAGVALALLAVQAGGLADDWLARPSAMLGHARHSFGQRAVRYLWRRLPPAPWRRGSPDGVEILFWRGRFRWRRSRKIAVVQDLTPRLHPEWHTAANVAEFDEFVRYVERRADAVVTVSEQSRHDIVDRTSISPAGVSVVPMPVHPQYARPRTNPGVLAAYGLTGRYVLSVATIEPRKNLRRLVKAFERVPFGDVTLVLAGPAGWDDAFAQFLAECACASRILLPGFVPLEHLPSLYSFASAVICPSLCEGFGLPVLEAMCCGAIVVASDIRPHRSTLGDDGIYFSPGDTGEIAAALMHALALDPAAAADYRAYVSGRAELHLQRGRESAALLAAVPRRTVAPS